MTLDKNVEGLNRICECLKGISSAGDGSPRKVLNGNFGIEDGILTRSGLMLKLNGKGLDVP